MISFELALYLFQIISSLTSQVSYSFQCWAPCSPTLGIGSGQVTLSNLHTRRCSRSSLTSRMLPFFVQLSGSGNTAVSMQQKAELYNVLIYHEQGRHKLATSVRVCVCVCGGGVHHYNPQCFLVSDYLWYNLNKNMVCIWENIWIWLIPNNRL